MRTRFAPSPTGYLHVGGTRTALFNYLLARQHGGQFLLRIEDTDAARNTEAARAAIFDGLRWLGLDWDEGPDPAQPESLTASLGNQGPYYQSQRQEFYDAAFETLRAADRVYEDQGAWRFRFERKVITVNDLICGEVSVDFINEAITPDMTIRRPDGSYIFHFVNVVDDHLMGISHVVRGEDHLTNTHKHLQLFEALGVTAPQYAHIPLLLNPDGSKMSKRDQGSAVAFYQQEGYTAEGVVNYLAQLGWTPAAGTTEPERELFLLPELVALFDLNAVHHHNATFDLTKCRWMSAQHLRQLPAATLAKRLSAPSQAQRTLKLDPARRDSLLELAKPRAEVLTDFQPFIAQFESLQITDPEKLAQVLNDQTILNALTSFAQAITNLPASEPWKPETIQTLLNQAAASANLKPGKLMLPLRLATTGSAQGLDLLPFLSLLGVDETQARLTQTVQATSAE